MKHLIQLILILICLQITVAFAEANDDGAIDYGTPSDQQWFYSASLGVSRYLYEEPTVMSIKGSMYDVHGEMLRPHWNSTTGFRLDGDLLTGQNTYNGFLQNVQTGVTTPNIQKSNDFIMQFSANWLKSFDLSSRIRGNWSLGGGLRYLYNHIDGDGSYGRQITYIYFPVGIELSSALGAKSTLVWGAEARALIFGYVRSQLSEAGSNFPDINNTQTSGYGGRLWLRYETQIGARQWFVQFDYDAWHIADSTADVVYVSGVGTKTYIEPRNWTEKTGLNVGLRF